MKAIAYDRFGGPEVLAVRALPAPEPKAGEARVAVQAAALNPKDVLVRKGRLRWLTRAPFPRIPGYDVAGTLIDPAPGLPAGTPIYGMIQRHRGGACAQIARLPFDQLACLPAGLTPVDAAALPLVSLTALQALRDELGVQPGQRVLLNGASGGVGTVAVQITKALGAEAVAVCSAANADLVRHLGADAVIDYQATDICAERGFDHVFDIYGNLSWRVAKPMLTAGGRYCTTVPSPGAIARGALRRLGLHRAALVVVQSRRADLEQISRWVETGALRPVIDQVAPWAEPAVGHRRIETRRARGKVVIEVPPA